MAVFSATEIRGKGWFALTERCMSLAREWTITAEIMVALAAVPCLCYRLNRFVSVTKPNRE